MVAAADTPIWVAIVSGIGGGLLGTLFSISHERGAEFRTRMLGAADTFLTALMHIETPLVRLDRVLASLTDGEPFPDNAREELHSGPIRAGIVDVAAAIPRIDLLFGSDSSTSEAAGGVIDGLRQAITSVDLTSGRLEQYRKGRAAADEAADRFLDAARNHVRHTFVRRAFGRALGSG